MELEQEHRLTALEDQGRTNARRLEELERRQDSLEQLITTVEVLANRQQAVERDVKEIKGDVKALTLRPGKKWMDLEDKLALTILGAAVGAALAQIGL